LSEYQHYSDRNPPWIKLHQLILEDYDFGKLPDATKWHALAITLLASRMDNHIPVDAKWIGMKVSANKPVDIDRLLSVRFLEVCTCERCVEQDASKSLASCTTEQSREEQRREEQISEVEAVWKSHLEARRIYFEGKTGRKLTRVPDLTPHIRKSIKDAIKQHGLEKAEAAGRGIFLSDFHTGKNDAEKEYLGPELCWRIKKDHNNVERFSELVLEVRDRRTAR
jgi:hypothetical protein